MTPTTRHILFATCWFLLFPLAAIPLVVGGGIPNATGVSMAWGLGLVACFASWAWNDAPAHGTSRKAALGFTVAWFLVFALAVIPYLFFTRGAKAGTVAALKFLSLCVACLIAFLLLPRVFGMLH